MVKLSRWIQNHRTNRIFIDIGVVGFVLLFTLTISAQTEPTGIPITDADVNAVADQLYYNGETLTACVALECAQIRSEVRTLLEQGNTQENVIHELVNRYTYRILGVTDDAVNAIARRLLCPICDNTPLDACQTAACQSWRNEIGVSLSQGMTEDEIIDFFARRYGDWVTGSLNADFDAIIARLYFNSQPLAACESVECAQIRGEIRVLLEQGNTAEETIYELANRYTYRILGISDDAVNHIAQRLFCPVCENIPLDTCPTGACQNWRNEIGIDLSKGMTEDEIINDFVRQFGDRVVGSPKDPVLQVLALAIPLILIVAILAAAFYTYNRWRSQSLLSQPAQTDLPPEMPPSDEDYLNQLERDLTK